MAIPYRVFPMAMSGRLKWPKSIGLVGGRTMPTAEPLASSKRKLKVHPGSMLIPGPGVVFFLHGGISLRVCKGYGWTSCKMVFSIFGHGLTSKYFASHLLSDSKLNLLILLAKSCRVIPYNILHWLYVCSKRFRGVWTGLNNWKITCFPPPHKTRNVVWGSEGSKSAIFFLKKKVKKTHTKKWKMQRDLCKRVDVPAAAQNI